jgi:GTP-binding protein
MSQFPAVRFLHSAAAPGQFPADMGWEMAVAGRSNAGKSSAINAILGRKGMARTSRTPGRTQLYNFFELVPGRRMVDLPGYGHAQVNATIRSTWGPMADALRQRDSFAALLLVVDARRGVGEQDLTMLDWAARPSATTHVLLNKADKLSRSEAVQTLRDSQSALGGLASCQLFSALKGTGLEEARGILRSWLSDSKEITPADGPPG